MAEDQNIWRDIQTDSPPSDHMVLLTDDNWIPSKFRGEPPPVKVGYFYEAEGRWVIFGASWFPTRWREIPYPEPKERSACPLN